MQVRKITEADAAPYLELRCALDSESKTLLLEPGERKTTVDEMRRTIQDILHQPNSMVFLATDE